MGWRIRPVDVPAQSGLLVSGQARVFGWAVHESGGVAVARLRLWDGGAASGSLLAPISLSADQSTRDWLGPHGIAMHVGLFYEVVTGTIEGSMWVGVWEDDPPQAVYVVEAAR